MRRNTVLYRMVSVDFLDREYYEAIRDSSTITNIRTADVKESFAPHYAEQVRQWLSEVGRGKMAEMYMPLAIGSKLHSTQECNLWPRRLPEPHWTPYRPWLTVSGARPEVQDWTGEQI